MEDRLRFAFFSVFFYPFDLLWQAGTQRKKRICFVEKKKKGEREEVRKGKQARVRTAFSKRLAADTYSTVVVVFTAPYNCR